MPKLLLNNTVSWKPNIIKEINLSLNCCNTINQSSDVLWKSTVCALSENPNNARQALVNNAVLTEHTYRYVQIVRR
jgi:hypothetical protein